MPSVNRCPMLGLKDDEHTHLAYASSSHVCYRTRKPTNVSIEHQMQFCLEREHINCPIFLNGGVQPGKIQKPLKSVAVPVAIPAARIEIEPETVAENALEAQNEENAFLPYLFSPRFARIWEITGVVIFLIVLLTAWWLFSNRDLFFPNHTPVQASIASTPKPTATATSTEIFLPDRALVAQLTSNPIVTDEAGSIITLTSTPSLTPSSTATPTISATMTATLTLAATELSCVAPYGWVLYTVRFGESLVYFANYFNVTIDYLMEANCTQSSILVAGQQLYLPWTPYPATKTPTRTATRTQSVSNPTATRTSTPTATFTSTQTSAPTYTSTPSPTTTSPMPTDTPFPTPTEFPSTPTVPAIPTQTPTETEGG